MLFLKRYVSLDIYIFKIVKLKGSAYSYRIINGNTELKQFSFPIFLKRK